MSRINPVLIAGGGLAGLAAAIELQRHQIPFRLFESSDRLGGRLRTDLVDGFCIDRGFQVLQTAYPEARRQLDYTALQLRPFVPGALVRARGRFVELSDPWRRPAAAFQTLFNGIGTLADRWKLARLRSQLVKLSLEAIDSAPDQSTEEYLLGTWGFSRDLVDRFFRPWFSGVFLENRLETSARFFQFVFKMLALGEAALPAAGMEAIPRQLALKLPADSCRTDSPVKAVFSRGLELESGERIEAERIILATEGPVAGRLLSAADQSGLGESFTPEVKYQSTLNYSFAAARPPLAARMLILNGELTGPIAHLCIPSNVAPSYAPPGQALVSVTAIASDGRQATSLRDPVRAQLREWFGPQVDSWRPLAESFVRNALPQQLPGQFEPGVRQYRLAPGRFRCGDYLGTASINGALLSGRESASELMRELSA